MNKVLFLFSLLTGFCSLHARDRIRSEADGNHALELFVKCYVEPGHFLPLQFAVGAGGNGMDTYVMARTALLLKGKRTYRVKPDKYYVRTYED